MNQVQGDRSKTKISVTGWLGNKIKIITESNLLIFLISLIVGVVAGFFLRCWVSDCSSGANSENSNVVQSENVGNQINLYLDGVKGTVRQLDEEISSGELTSSQTEKAVKQRAKLQKQLDKMILLKQKYKEFGSMSAIDQEELLDEINGVLFQGEAIPVVEYKLVESETNYQQARDTIAILKEQMKELQFEIEEIYSEKSTLEKELEGSKGNEAKLKARIRILNEQIKEKEAEKLKISEVVNNSPPEIIELDDENISVADSIDSALTYHYYPSVKSGDFFVPGLTRKGREYILYQVKKKGIVRLKFSLDGDLSRLKKQDNPRIIVRVRHPIKSNSGGVVNFEEQDRSAPVNLVGQMSFTYDLLEGVHLGEYIADIYFMHDEREEPKYIGTRSFLVRRATEKIEPMK